MKAIMVTYHSWTTTKPARYVARDSDNNKYIGTTNQTVVDVALAFCQKMDWHGELVSGGWKKGSEVFVFTGNNKYKV